MAKKKKSGLKPVARGFATTSVPKKITQSEVDQDSTEAANAGIPIVSEEDHCIGEKAPASSDPKNECDLEKAEEQSLQNLVDKLQDKTEREITRTIKFIDTERRYSKTLPILDVDPALVEQILQLDLEHSAEVNRDPIDNIEEKAIARLGITYGVLRRLGFSQSRVEECLRSIHGTDLDEAYDWIYVHCSEDELSENNTGATRELKVPHSSRRATKNKDTTTSRTLSQFMVSPIVDPGPAKPRSKLDANAPVFVPSFSTSVVESNQPQPYTHSPASTDNLSGTDDPVAEYVRLKMRIIDLTRGVPSEDMSLVQSLQRQLETTKNHYFFDERDAESLYRMERKKADSLSLERKLRGHLDITQNAPSASKANNVLPDPQTSIPSSTVTDVFDAEGEGGMFELLDAPSTAETSVEGTVVRIRDMPFPKHWSGKTPKTLLSEAVAKIDQYAAITYQLISGLSRAKRASVRVLWEGGQTDEWVMNDIACPNDSQAEQYISMIALHTLTFPATEGFATGSLSGQTFFRLLPSVFRDLWDELETGRKTRQDSINRDIWTTMRSLLEQKVAAYVKFDDKTVKRSNDVKGATTSHVPSYNDLAPEQLIASFRARVASAAYQEMLFHRNQLPIAKHREDILSSLERSQILVLSGETGCGKSTQVPAFILEDQLSRGFHCKIVCTEPRRISAISLAQRVSRELGDAPGAVGTLSSLVGYSIRLESNTTRNTRLEYVTNGIALRMLEGESGYGGQGTAFDDITHIIIDEVHERSIESDFLLIVLKSLLMQRSHLKIILMSATVNAEKISAFFGGCPTLHVPGRTFPVDVRFLEDAVEFTQWSIPENSPYARRLNDKYYMNKNRSDWSEEPETVTRDDDDDENYDDRAQPNIKLEKRYSAQTAATINLLDERVIPYDLIMQLLQQICFEDPEYFSFSSAILIFMPGLGEIRRMTDLLSEHPLFGADTGFRIYPLHSTLSNENQNAVFDIPPLGTRKIVIATNIAETGITIPDITCVIDTGKHREMRFDEKRQISRLLETFVAKSNAAQRRGRAGRVRNGLCFHLFTKLRHDTLLAEHPLPEMMRLSLSDLALRIKIMKVKLGNSIEDVLCRAMDPPASINVQRAVSALVEVRALTPSEEITPMGRLLSKLPTDVHLGKFLLTAVVFRCLDPALTIAAALSSKSPFVSPFGLEHDADRAKAGFRIDNSDFLTIHNAFASWRRASANPGFLRKFCTVNFLSHQNLQQIEELRQQFLGYLIDSSFVQVSQTVVRELSRARYGRNKTRFVAIPSHLDENSSNSALVNAALAAGLYPKILSIDSTNGQMRTISNNLPAFFHPSSVNFGRKPSNFGCNHLAYFTLMHSKKLYAWETSPVHDLAILLLCGECEFKARMVLSSCSGANAFPSQVISNTVVIDRKIKFRLPPKATIALKRLRSQLGNILAQQFKSKPLAESQILWHNLAMVALGNIKIEVEEAETMKVIIH
ncbi:P-loop containing nucleoside triphosphate hydrolase protein [Hygrophoropsis aurantiaca]|uniref:P-loop containing nucleoside triphosphate hydrolase protein n=1 Tax=Hygrophoropsis aurantiaca TaxID=72124 RepID=A0ACB8A8U7_9AGAM|nr:P-loop containing nucleoside triphosphate hydrolase protein [Hygrophoropsis aurantiaca]